MQGIRKQSIKKNIGHKRKKLVSLLKFTDTFNLLEGFFCNLKCRMLGVKAKSNTGIQKVSAMKNQGGDEDI